MTKMSEQLPAAARPQQETPPETGLRPVTEHGQSVHVWFRNQKLTFAVKAAWPRLDGA
jgi:hypothetical protein